MQVTIHTQHFDLTPGIRQFAIDNLREPLERIWDKEGTTLEVILRDLRGTKGGLDKECRCILYFPAGPKLVITELTEDMRKSIHQCRKRLLRRTRQYITHKLQGNRYPRKYFAAQLNSGELVDRAHRSEEAHGNETGQ
jgi:putative sigma-54 modulation protein